MIAALFAGWLICFGLCLMISAIATNRDDAELAAELFTNGTEVLLAGAVLGVLA